jgi:sulfite reductase (NADPH) flavoprotein alpha-component
MANADAGGYWSNKYESFISPAPKKRLELTVSDDGTQTPSSSLDQLDIQSAADSTDEAKAERILGGYCDGEQAPVAKFVIRPDNPDAVKVMLLRNDRLTPADYDRNVFHLALRVEGTPLASYEAGDCISIYPTNPRDKVDAFLSGMGYDGSSLLECDSFCAGADDGVYVMSVSQIFTEYLDVFGVPSKSFYVALSKFAQDFVDREQIAELSLQRKNDDFEKRKAQGVTYASTILEFSSLKLKPLDFLDLVPFVNPRLYSIASSPKVHPGEVHLLLVENRWNNSFGEERVGLASGYLDKIKPKRGGSGLPVVASLVRSPILKLPKNPMAPVIMAGMGTGLAPFRAFIEERSTVWKMAQAIGLGMAVGQMRLYFGARHKHAEFLYQSELEAYEAQGWLTLRCAWSRDQASKIYVQNLIEEDGEAIWEALRPEAGGAFYICGPLEPLPEIRKALSDIFIAHGSSAKYLDEMEATGRFATEVY